MENYREVKPLVKIITGKTAEEVDKKAEDFEKQHTVVEIKQKSKTIMFIFYIE